MRQARLILGGVIMNWTAFAVSAVVSFFLAPFVVHRLGGTVYGVWVLVNSAVAYMALLDLGLRGAVMHLVARHRAQGDHLESGRAVSAALWFRLGISGIVVITTLIFAALVSTVFAVPSEFQSAARWAILFSGMGFAVTLTCGVFGGVLAALHRFDLLSAVGTCQTLVGASGVVYLLLHSHGIVALAVWQFIVTGVANIALIALSLSQYRELRVSLRIPERDMVRKLWNYGVYVFLINIAGQIIYYTDNIIVGVFLSVLTVTFYSIAGRLIEYLGQLAVALTQTFMPLASGFDAEGQQRQLRRLLLQGTRAALFVSLPVAVLLFFRGKTFIGAWMGTEYGAVSGRILQILLLSSTVVAGNRASGNIVYGLGKHRPFAIWLACEAVANFTLSIFLARRIGIEGVAWGTAIPSLLTNLLLWPRYVCKILDVRIRSYVWGAWVRPGLAVVPFALACVLVDRYWIATSLFRFFLQVAALVPLFGLGVVVVFWREVSWQLRNRDSLVRAKLLEALGRGF